MAREVSLGLNEAQLVVNSINTSSPLELYHQIDQCFGCPLVKLEPLQAVTGGEEQAPALNQFVVGTKYNLQLELRPLNSSASDTSNATTSWCRLSDVALNSHGQYRIDVTSATSPSDGQLNCSLRAIDEGECLLCPFATLICILFAIVVLEQVYSKFWLPKRERARRHYGRKLSSADGPPDEHGSGGGGSGCGGGGGAADAGSEENSNGASEDAVAQMDTTDTNEESIRRRSSPGCGQLTNGRIESLDVFRGLTLAGMIFANYGGAGYVMWEHKPWDGITLADFVFPFFIFSMGASVAISVPSLVKRHPKSFRGVAGKILRRSAILALVGVCLNSRMLNYDQADGLSKLRLTGVLQRFSLSYLVIAFMYTIELTLNKWTRAQSLANVPYLSKMIGTMFEVLTAINYLAIYVYFTFYFEYDAKCPVGYTGPGGQTDSGRHMSCTGGSAAWLDRLILGSDHMYDDQQLKAMFKTQVSHDPEGILGYATSILLTLIGLQCGKILIESGQSHKQKVLSLAQWSVALAFASTLTLVIPINKRLWSLTFIIVTALAAYLVITLLYILIDVYSCKKTFLLRLLSSAGKNSIFLYVGHSLIFRMLPWWFPVAEQSSHLQMLLRLSWATFVWLLVAHYMALKRMFIKI